MTVTVDRAGSDDGARLILFDGTRRNEPALPLSGDIVTGFDAQWESTRNVTMGVSVSDRR